ncbi:MAG: hydrogenase small subunit [Rhodospirillaceae bacterium]|nr:hydrogenase small subunit [Rhodospirillaceae bacterium]
MALQQVAIPVPSHESDEPIGKLDSYEGALGGVTRREFLMYCTGVAAALGLSPALGVRIANATTSAARPPVIWLSGQACTGCTETLLRAHHPTLESLILDQISLDYHETLCSGAGHQAEEFRRRSMEENHGRYLLVIDGAIPTGDTADYCKIAGERFVDSVTRAAEGAGAIIAMGSCSSWGGVPSSSPNPTNARSAQEVLPDHTVVTIPGCPPNPYNFLVTVLHYLTFGELPALDQRNRPRFAYGRLIHENCERRPHFDAGRFAREFGDEGHRQGWCLYYLGCKGPETWANCPAIGFNDIGESAWPVGIGHPCFGCTEQGVGFTKSIHSLATLQTVTPPTAFPRVVEEQGGLGTAAVGVAAGVAGAAVGAAAVLASRLAKHGPPPGEAPPEQASPDDPT